ncbi:MAG: hypothetical protein IPN96_23650 [Anaerolineales bacterium]|nr:hypothetical protein [Anaerolineales bacterium]
MVSFTPLSIWLALGGVLALIFALFVSASDHLPVVIGYNIMRFKFLRTDDLVRRGVMYALLTVSVVSGYALLVTGISFMLNTNLPSNNVYLVGIFIFVLVIVLEPLRTRLQSLVDTVFFRGERAFAEQLQDFSRKLTTALDLNTIGLILREQIASTLARAGSTSTHMILSTTFSPPFLRGSPPHKRYSVHSHQYICAIFSK